MKQTVSFSDFVDAFRNHDRMDQFSFEALHALFDYLEECEEDGSEIELDVIALCCEYVEYTDAVEAAKEYSGTIDTDREEDEDDNDYAERMLEELRYHTTVIDVNNGNGGIILQSF